MCDLKNEYLLNPCGTLSIPYWKNKIIIVPPRYGYYSRKEI